MAESNPTLLSAGIPTEAPPNDQFTFEARVEQGGPDPWASEDWCVQSDLDIRGWKTPVAVFVDGEEHDREVLCLSSGDKGTATLSVGGLREGAHTVEVRVYKVGGNAYDLSTTPHEVNDDVSKTLTVEADARDPSEPTTAESLTEWFNNLAASLGGSTTMLAAGMVLAVVLLGVL